MPIGPTLPPHLAPPQAADDDEEDDYLPALPPHLQNRQSNPRPAGPSLGPTIPASGPSRPSAAPPAGPSFEEDDDSDDEIVGPVPVPSAYADDDPDAGVREFLEREERMRKDAAERAKPKVMKREEWMLVPPSSGSLSNIDPLRKRPSTFSRNTEEKHIDSSVWTETPAEKAQRIADEVAGVKRKKDKAGDRIMTAEEEESERKRKRRDQDIKGELGKYTVSAPYRGPSLLDQHTSKLAKKGKNEDDAPAIWDHARDMGITGRLMTDQERSKKINDARGLGDRFGHGKSGAYQM
ncbi:hypothetical protein L198_05921 [Cryptococcus wingfieldii CBS 7118]|uniref:DUF3752 domain-containing protein n=1 Tax=Cryptococcus wingfieldii CBS 7118 TaxID=1295528 RepID=A0A1E3IS18_9TREE|nr:hypothetical protein L198_05921 [Cryptococcus wingfieldii CBS 7118]ODN91407.1 hypothetical protein L198_05921 [Cryptococcus wingfieldii CBS 7118]